MKYLIHLFLLLSLPCLSIAQTVFRTQEGEVHLNASTPLEDIVAVNPEVNAILKTENSSFAVVMLIRDFKFRRALMQEHFNENYMESDSYPKGYFTGTIIQLDAGDLTGEAKKFSISGELTIHGVTREVTTEIQLSNQEKELLLTADFVINPETYGIKVPRLLFSKIAKEVAVKVKLPLRAQ